MGSLDEIFKDKFNANLGDENWLEPSQDLLNNVYRRIEKQENRKRRGGYLWFLPMLTLIGAISWLWIDSFKTNAENQTSVIEVESEKYENSNVFTFHKDENETVESERVLADKEKQVKNTNNGLEAVATRSSIEKYVLLKDIKIKNQLLDELKSEMVRNKTQAVYQPSINSDIQSSEQPTTQSSSNAIIPIFNSIIVQQLERINSDLLPQNNQVELIFNHSEMQSVNGQEEERIQLELVSMATLSNWDFKLNNGYTEALASADYYHNNGNGIGTQMQLKALLKSGVYFGLGLSYDQSEFSSGHNSSIYYNGDLETDNMADFEIPMATPLGFISSNFTMTRSAMAHDDLNLDLTVFNRHEIRSLAAGFVLGYRHQLSKSLFIGLESSINTMYLVSISNTLEIVDTHNEFFNASNHKVILDQQNINRWTTQVGLSLEFGYDLNRHFGIGMGIRHLRSVSPSFETSGLSSNVDITQYAIGLRYKI